MNLSNELLAHIGELLSRETCNTPDGPRYTKARRMQLEWVRAIESALREDDTHMLAKRQAG